MKRINSFAYRFGSLALAIAVLLSSIMMNSILVSGENTPDIWDGTAVKPVLGSGTASDPYLIETPEHLAYVVESTKAEWGYYHFKKWFKLTNDIYLNDVSSADWYTKNNLKSWYAQDSTFANNVGFSGALDGDGHTIYGLYWDSKSDSSNTVVGLFPKANTASEFVTIKNLGIDKAYINVSATEEKTYKVGTIFGQSYVPTDDNWGILNISNCSVGKDVKLINKSTGVDTCTGGLIGYSNSYFNITSCHFGGSIDADKYAGSIVAKTWNRQRNQKASMAVNGCIISSEDKINIVNECIGLGVIVTANSTYTAGTASNGTTHIDLLSMLGEQAKTSMPDLDYKNVWMTEENKVPCLRVFRMLPVGENKVWEGKTLAPSNLKIASGTEKDPYLIQNAENLAWLVDLSIKNPKETEGKYYQLEVDIQLNDVSVENWKVNKWYTTTYTKNTEQGFMGTFDGNGHKIYGLYATTGINNSALGLFPAATGATIKNLAIDKVYIKTTNSGSKVFYAGGIVGVSGCTDDKNNKILSISKCSVGENVEIDLGDINNSYAGGILGNTTTYFDIRNCSFAGSITNAKNIAGIVAQYVANGNGTNGTKEDVGLRSVKTCLVSSNYPATKAETVMAGVITCSNVYTVGSAARGSLQVPKENMIGEAAKTNMPGLNYIMIWDIVDGDVPVLSLFNEKTGGSVQTEIWQSGGVKEVTPEKGNGTENNPYLIETAENLAWLVGGTTNKTISTSGKYYKLTNDIYLNDIKRENWMLNKWYSASGDNGTFAGIFDGDGHTVYGLYSESKDLYAGLFPRAHNATIKNVAVDRAYISSSSTGPYIGSIVGGDLDSPNYMWNTTLKIENCFVGNNVRVVSLNAEPKGMLGGIIGYTNTYFEISNCAFNGTLENGLAVGGIIGRHWDQGNGANGTAGITGPRSIKYSYCAPEYQVVGEQVGVGNYASCVGVYTTGTASNGATKVSAEEMLGASSKTGMSLLDYNNTWRTVTGQTPELIIFKPFDRTSHDIYVWDGNEDKPGEGKGTVAEPYLIKSSAELAWLVSYSLKYGEDTEDENYKLTKDIYLNDISKSNWKVNEWYTANINSSGGFRGVFDGDGHVVRGLYALLDDDNTQSGLFPKVWGGTIKKIGLEYSEISGVNVNNIYKIGGIVGDNSPTDGNAVGKVTISSCYVGEDVTLSAVNAESSVGGIIGCAKGFYSVSDCYFRGTLNGDGYLGGIVGKNAVPQPINGKYTTDGRTEIKLCQLIENAYVSSSYQAVGNGNAECKNVYTVGEAQSGTVHVEKDNILDELAGEQLKGFDFGKIWSMIANDLPVLSIFPTTKETIQINGIWQANGQKEVRPGNALTAVGNAEDPILIRTAENLAWLVSNSLKTGNTNKYYKLVNDIYLNDISLDNWKINKWYTLKDSVSTSNPNCFSGVFDGDGHMIYGLYDGSALFPAVRGATIKNVGIDYTDKIEAGLVGVNQNKDPSWCRHLIINKCFIGKNSIIGSDNAKYAGGFVQHGGDGFKISNCYFGGTLLGNARGFLYGAAYEPYNDGSSIWRENGTDKIKLYHHFNDCYSDKNYSAVGTILNGSVYYSNIYTAGSGTNDGVTHVDAENMIGSTAKQEMPGLDYDNVWKITDDIPMLRVFAGESSSERPWQWMISVGKGLQPTNQLCVDTSLKVGKQYILSMYLKSSSENTSLTVQYVNDSGTKKTTTCTPTEIGEYFRQVEYKFTVPSGAKKNKDDNTNVTLKFSDNSVIFEPILYSADDKAKENIITNSNFSGGLQGWYIDGGSPTKNQKTYELSDETFKVKLVPLDINVFKIKDEPAKLDKDYMVYIYNPNSSNGRFGQWIDLEIGGKYRYTVDFKGFNDTASPVVSYYSLVTGDLTEIKAVTDISPEGNYSFEFTVPTNALIRPGTGNLTSVFLGLNQGNAKTRIYMAHPKLTKENSSVNLLSNSDFKQGFFSWSAAGTGNRASIIYNSLLSDGYKDAKLINLDQNIFVYDNKTDYYFNYGEWWKIFDKPVSESDNQVSGYDDYFNDPTLDDDYVSADESDDSDGQSTGGKKLIAKKIYKKKKNQDADFDWMIIIIVASALVLVAGGTIAFLLIRKKRRKGKVSK